MTAGLLCSVLSLTSILSQFLPLTHTRVFGHGLAALVRSYRLELLLIPVPYLISVILGSWIVHQLDRGVRQQLWSKAELDGAKALVFHPVLRKLPFTLLALIVTLIGVRLIRGQHFGSLGFYVYAVLPIMQLQQKLRPPKPAPRRDISVARPIHSDLWGKPPVS